MLSTVLIAAAAKSSGSNLLLPILIVGFGAVYFFILRPRQKAQQQQRSQNSQIDIGDVVVTIGGVRGVVIALDEDQVTIATGQMPGDDPAQSAATHITFLRKAVGQKITPPAEEPEATEGPVAPEDGGAESDPEQS